MEPDQQIINNIILTVGGMVQDYVKPTPVKTYKLKRDIIILSLDEIYKYLVEFNNKFECDGDQLSSNLSDFLEHKYDDDEYEKDDVEIKNGEIKTIYYDPGGQGGSELVTRIFKHNNVLINIDYCAFDQLNDFNTSITFNFD